MVSGHEALRNVDIVEKATVSARNHMQRKFYIISLDYTELCCVMLCYVVLCCVVFCCIVCCVVLCCVWCVWCVLVLCCVVLHDMPLHCILL